MFILQVFLHCNKNIEFLLGFLMSFRLKQTCNESLQVCLRNYNASFRSKFVGNKAKGGILKRVFQENKARQIFQKNEHFLPPDTLTYCLIDEEL